MPCKASNSSWKLNTPNHYHTEFGDKFSLFDFFEIRLTDFKIMKCLSYFHVVLKDSRGLWSEAPNKIFIVQPVNLCIIAGCIREVI